MVEEGLFMVNIAEMSKQKLNMRLELARVTVSHHLPYSNLEATPDLFD